MDFSLLNIPNGLIEHANITKIIFLNYSVHVTTSCGFLSYRYFCSCSFTMLDLAVHIQILQIQVVQSVLSNLAESNVNQLTCKLK